ncbi:hypothetical protein [Chromobacterium violaceum]|uniref:hypothetical protein n=1 Tax=Chromobacterium violaceum TaxID=536 RepID=UPI00194E826C|nr:hypothetical protein [Chromobacterium violaceum]QRO33997.1 hypothetical protein I6K04_04435 [Chromobacterium violaceum]QRQ16200.1 hypothetical protein I6K03_18295 [Chromobacterium violaceum]
MQVVTPADFLHVAQNYLNNASHESEFRAVASRAYYSIFHACDGYYASGKYTLIPSAESVGSHEVLFSAFLNASPNRCGKDWATIKRIGMMANSTLKPLRRDADYDLKKSFPKINAELMVEKAKVILGEISNI